MGSRRKDSDRPPKTLNPTDVRRKPLARRDPETQTTRSPETAPPGVLSPLPRDAGGEHIAVTDAEGKPLRPSATVPGVLEIFRNLGPAPDGPDDPTNPALAGETHRERTGSRANKLLRRVEALNLRITGHDYRVIAEELGVSVKTAYYDVQDALAYLAKHERQLAERIRALELARCDAMQACLWPSIESGDAESVEVALKVMERRAKLLGLDAPTEVIVTKRPLATVPLAELRAKVAGALAKLDRRLDQPRLPPAPASADTPRVIDAEIVKQPPVAKPPADV